MPHSQPKASTTVQGPSNHFSTRILALDRIGDIRDAHRAFEALEQLVSPSGINDSEAMDLERSDLGCLMRVLCSNMRNKIDSALLQVEGASDA